MEKGSSGKKAGTLLDLEPDFAPVAIEALDLAFLDRKNVSLAGKTIDGIFAKRDVWVCGPGAFTILKALAFRNRNENKDAYDLFYVLRNYGEGIEDVIAHLSPIINAPMAQKALAFLSEDFADNNGLGAVAVAKFSTGDFDKEATFGVR